MVAALLSGMASMTTAGFADRLAAAVEAKGAPVCVGLDPVIEQIPVEHRGGDEAETLARFGAAVIRAVAERAPIVKVQAACYERYGATGVGALEATCAAARAAGLLVLLDAKRGDIGISAAHYAAAAVSLGADAITVNGYLGMETVEPYVERGLGVFVLVRTSNPGSDEVQSVRVEGGGTVAEMLAERVARLGERHVGVCGLSGVGAVVGATKAADAARLRARMERQVFLVPGYGAQGGTAEDIRGMVRSGERGARAGVLVTASRSVIYPKEGGVGEAAEKLRREVGEIVG